MIDTNTPQQEAALWLFAIFLWFGLSIVYRIRSGLPLYARAAAGNAFTERWASGRAGSGIAARLSSAKNCLHVQVDKGLLKVHPHFPITLGFVPEIYGMDYVIALDTISSATILGGRYAQTVELRYRTSTGKDQTLLLLLKNAERFIQVVHEARSDA